MSSGDVEQNIRQVAAEWAFVQDVETIDETEHTLKMRLYVDSACFIQVYTNTQKQIISYTLVLHRSRIFGRDCEGGMWHRHPHTAPDRHDFSLEGQRAVSLNEFLRETQQLLYIEGIL